MSSHNSMRAVNFKKFEKNTLRGFFDLELPSRMIIRGCTLHQKGDRQWVGMPGKPIKAKDGTDTWANVVDFADKEAKYRFDDLAVAAALAAVGEAE